jgi:hypothetical protein
MEVDMAKRKQLFHPDEVKKKIQTSQLINRLQENALSKEETMTPGQIASANSLLDRVVPKLKAVEHSGEVETVIKRRTIYEPKPE